VDNVIIKIFILQTPKTLPYYIIVLPNGDNVVDFRDKKQVY